MAVELTIAEQATLRDCETVIERGIKSFAEVGRALLAIKTDQLYRVTHRRFEDYCSERWNMTGRYPPRILAYGAGGVGKTAFAAAAPNPLFLLSEGETGLETLMDAGTVRRDMPFVEAKNWGETMSVIGGLIREQHPYRSLVVDCVDGVANMGRKFTCETQFKNDWGPRGYENFHAGDKAFAGGTWESLMKALDQVRARGLAVILLAHMAVAKSPNPQGPDFPKFTGDMLKEVWRRTFNWADCVLFMQHDMATIKDQDDKHIKDVELNRCRGGLKWPRCRNRASWADRGAFLCWLL